MRGPRLLALLVCVQAAGIIAADEFAADPRAAGWAVLLAAGAWMLAAAVTRRWLPFVLGAAFLAGYQAQATALIAAHSGVTAGEHLVDARIQQRHSSRAGHDLVLRLGSPGLPDRVELFVSSREIEANPALATAVVGERWRFRLRLRPLRGPVNPGSIDRVRRLERRGVGAMAALTEPRLAVRTGSGVRATWERGMSASRRRAREGLARHGEAGALLRALVLGDRSGLEAARPAFARLGVAHLLAISGLHLALVLGGVYFALRALTRSACVARAVGGYETDTRVWALAIALAAAATYAAVAGAGMPLRRALCFASAAAAGFALRRAGTSRAGFWAACSAMLVLEPAALFELGPQLSFVAAGALIHARPALRQLESRWLAGLDASLRVSATALAATAPVLAAHGIASAPAGLAANLLLVPWTTLVLLPAALIAVPLAVLGIGESLIDVAAGCGDLTLAAVATAAQALPGTDRPGVPGALALWLSGAVALAAARARGTGSRALLSLLVSGVLWLGSSPQGPRPPYLLALDVGSGDALLLRSPDHAVLIDGGLARRPAFDLGRSRVVPALAAVGVERLDLVVATHADADHVGGLVAVLDRVPVAGLWLPAGQAGDPGFAALLEAAKRQGATVEEISSADSPRLIGAGLRLEALWPPERAGQLDRNAASLVLRASLGQVRILLAGDLGARGEAALLASGRSLEAEVLKVGHHGSATSTSAAWLAAVQPDVAIVSAACERRGLPAAVVLERLRSHAIAVWWTARDGAVFIRTPPLVAHALAPGRGCGRAR